MKTLIVSIYDAGYGGRDACEIEDGLIKEVELDDTDYSDFDVWWSWDREYSIRPELLNRYDTILVCNNGSIEFVKNSMLDIRNNEYEIKKALEKNNIKMPINGVYNSYRKFCIETFCANWMEPNDTVTEQYIAWVKERIGNND